MKFVISQHSSTVKAYLEDSDFYGAAVKTLDAFIEAGLMSSHGLKYERAIGTGMVTGPIRERLFEIPSTDTMTLKQLCEKGYSMVGILKADYKRLTDAAKAADIVQKVAKAALEGEGK